MEMPLTGNTFFFEWEVRLMEMLQAGLGEKVISAVSALSMFGEELLLIVVLGLIYWSYDKKMGVRIGLNVLMVNVCLLKGEKANNERRNKGQ